MAQRRYDREPDEDPRAWVGIAKSIALLLLFALFFLLARRMAQHHFFSGGAQDYHNSPTGP